MSPLRLCKFPAGLYINVDEIASLDLFVDPVRTEISLKNGEIFIIDHSPEEVIGFIRTNTADIFSIS